MDIMGEYRKNCFMSGFFAGMLFLAVLLILLIVFMFVKIAPLNAVDIITMSGERPDGEVSVMSANDLYGAIVSFYDSILTYIGICIAVIAIFSFFHFRNQIKNDVNISVKDELAKYVEKDLHIIVDKIKKDKDFINSTKNIVTEHYENLKEDDDKDDVKKVKRV